MRSMGTQLFRSPDGAVGSYIQLAGIMDLTLPEETRGVTDITPLDNQDDRAQKESGMIDVGESEFALLYEPGDAAQVTIKDDFDTGNTVYYKVVFRDGSIQLFKGFVSKLGKELPKAESILRKVSIQATGITTENPTDNTLV